jgi:hypothetical protein
MLRWTVVVALAAASAAVYVRFVREPEATPLPPLAAAQEAPPPHAPRADPPRGPPVDATQIVTGRLAMERLPPEVGTSLETFSNEIVRNAEETAKKQARIHGTCAPGSAIRLITEDGSVRCQAIAHGMVSVSAVTAISRLSSTVTEVGNVPGGTGRYQVDGENDYLVAPIVLPDGASVTALSYSVFDSDPDADSEAFLYRSDDEAMASVKSSGAEEKVRTVATEEVRLRKVDARHAYFIYFQVSRTARARLMPIAATVSYKLN